MKRTIRLNESELRTLIAKSVRKVLSEGLVNRLGISKEDLYSLDGEYTIYFDGQELEAYIDVDGEEFMIGDWSVEGEEAIEALTDVYSRLRDGCDSIESAIESFAYDEAR